MKNVYQEKEVTSQEIQEAKVEPNWLCSIQEGLGRAFTIWRNGGWINALHCLMFSFVDKYAYKRINMTIDLERLKGERQK